MASPAMLWQTFFACDKVDFSEVQNVNGGSTHQETWAPVQVFISEVTDNRRWLMVVHNHGGPPVIFRVVEEGWVLSCDERSLTMLMRMEDPIYMSVTVHKLRFHFIKDFWVFVAHLTYGRLASYSMHHPNVVGAPYISTDLYGQTIYEASS